MLLSSFPTSSVLKSDLLLYDLSSHDEFWLLLVGCILATDFFAGVISANVTDGTVKSRVM
jgi:hypothetical protein